MESLRNLYFIKLLPLILLPCLISLTANAGEDIIAEWDVLIDGFLGAETVTQGDKVNICYSSHRYAFAGGSYPYIYTVFIVTPKLYIKNSIGKNAVNLPEDVEKVKKVLRNLNYFHGPINGIVDDRFISTIEQFQRNIAKISKPDGKINVNKKTIKVLRVENSSKLFVNLQRRVGDSTARQQMTDCTAFFAPQRVSLYDILYCELSYIPNYKIGTAIGNDRHKVILLNSEEERMLKRDHLREYANRIFPIGQIRVVPKDKRPKIPFTVYLEINKQALVLDTKIKPGASDDPMNFSWFIKPEFLGEVEYRYRMVPDQKDYSSWSKINSTNYYFISAGANRFEVQTRFRKRSSTWQDAPSTIYDFHLDRAFVSKPILKVIVDSIEEPDFADLQWDKIYGDSKALIIGVEKFQDSKFSPLPYISKDVNAMKSSLSKLGFSIEVLSGNVSRDKIIASVKNFIEFSKPKDRLIVYFSTHGFSKKPVNSIGFMAPSDCDSSSPEETCLQLDYIESILQNAINKPVKHMLIVIDACSSGLGIIAKDISYPEIKIALKNGSHMLTAGMADQTARMEGNLQMSIFTYYLTKGLSGEADLIQDGVVSLSELLLYVRYQVAKFTDGEQTPMMGRLSGAGEMIFKLNLDR